MDYLSAIEKRASRRAYIKSPMDNMVVSKLCSLITQYNEASGLTISFMENGKAAFQGIRKSYGMFSGVRSLLVMKGPKDDPHLKEKIGYYGEKLILHATDMNLGTCWVGGTFDASAISAEPGEQLICVITVGNVPEDKTLKEKILHKAIHRHSKTIGEMSEAVGTPPSWFSSGMEAVCRAPSTRNTQKVLFLYKAGVLRASIPDTYTLDYVDLGIAKLHFELGANGHFELGNGGKFYPEKRDIQ